MKPSGPRLLFVGVLFIIYSILFLVISLFTDLFLLDSVLVGFMSLEGCAFLLGCQICWHIIVHIILSPNLFFGISAVSLEISPFLFLILPIWVLPFSG